MDAALRNVSAEGTFKPTTLQSALLKFDKKNDCKFSKASDIKPGDWAKTSRSKVRDAFAKENKRRNAQKHRDEEKKAEEPTSANAMKGSQPKPKKKSR